MTGIRGTANSRLDIRDSAPEIRIMTARVALHTVLLCALVASPLQAQSFRAGIGVGAMFGTARGIASDCAQYDTRTGLAVTAAVDVLENLLALQASADFHPFRQGPTCAYSPVPSPPMDGTYTSFLRRDLLAARFAASDLRLRIVRETAAGLAGAVTVGAGGAWRPGNDLPYAVVGISLAAPLGPLRFVVDGEWYRVRVRLEEVRRTWSNFQLVSVEQIGIFHEWNSAGRIGVRLVAPVRF